MLSENLENKLREKIKTLNLNNKKQELLIKNIDNFAEIIIKNVQNRKKEN